VSKLTTDVVTYCTEASNQKSKYAYRKILFHKKSTGYKDCLKTSMTQCCITPSELETLTMDRTGGRSTCKSVVEEFDVRHIQELEAKRDLCKSGPPSTSSFECQICHQMCRSQIGLLAHNKSHS